MTVRERVEKILAAPGVSDQQIHVVVTDLVRALADEIDSLRAETRQALAMIDLMLGDDRSHEA